MASSIPFISWAQNPQILRSFDRDKKMSEFQSRINVLAHSSGLLLWMTGTD